jgi:hypothetical protein
MCIFDETESLGSPHDFEAPYKEAIKELKRLGCALARLIRPVHRCFDYHQDVQKWRIKVEPFFRDTINSMPSCRHLQQFANYSGYPPDWCWRRIAVQMRALWACEEEEHDNNVYAFASRTGSDADSVLRLLTNTSLYDTDHITPMSEYRDGEYVAGDTPPHDLLNLRCVCIVCHAVKHPDLERQPRFMKFVAGLKKLR